MKMVTHLTCLNRTCVNHTTVFSGLKVRLDQQSISYTDPINSCRLWRQADLLLNIDFAELLCNLGSVPRLPSSHFLIYRMESRC